jgi:glutaredoxin
MKSSTIALAALAAALLAASAAQAQTSVYRWVDKDGKVHFSDAPPAEDAKDVKQKQMGGGGEESSLPYATQIAMKRNPVTFYSGNACGELCDSARNLLSSRGIPFAERNAESNPADAEALKKLTGGELRVPVLLIGQNTLKGYEESTWQSALDSAGYPRTRLPSQPSGRTVSPAPEGAPEPGNK